MNTTCIWLENWPNENVTSRFHSLQHSSIGVNVEICPIKTLKEKKRKRKCNFNDYFTIPISQVIW